MKSMLFAATACQTFHLYPNVKIHSKYTEYMYFQIESNFQTISVNCFKQSKSGPIASNFIIHQKYLWLNPIPPRGNKINLNLSKYFYFLKFMSDELHNVKKYISYENYYSCKRIILANGVFKRQFHTISTLYFFTVLSCI